MGKGILGWINGFNGFGDRERGIDHFVLQLFTIVGTFKVVWILVFFLFFFFFFIVLLLFTFNNLDDCTQFTSHITIYELSKLYLLLFVPI